MLYNVKNNISLREYLSFSNKMQFNQITIRLREIYMLFLPYNDHQALLFCL